MADDTKIKLNDNTSIDLSKLIESRLLVQANSGGGKSWALRRLLEQTHGKVQQIVIDSEGEFSTLREKHDFILAGKDGDTPAEPRSAALLARKLLELKVSAIIDLYELHPQERKRFVRLFLDALINAPKELWHPCIVVIDEAHTYAPEKGQSEAMDAVIGLAALGRKRGYCAVLATQRISKLNKDAAAECNNKLIGRATQDIDMKRAGDELGFMSREQMLSLRALKPGEFYAFGPAISDEVTRVTIGPVATTHPKAGSRALTRTVPPTSAIKRVLGELADLPAEAEQEARTVAELKQQVKDLTTQLRNRPIQKIPQEKIKTVEVPVLKEGQLARLEQALAPITSAISALRQQPVRIAQKVAAPARPSPQPRAAPEVNPVASDNITGPEMRIIDAIAMLEYANVPRELPLVAACAKYSVKSSGFIKALSMCRTAGYVDGLELTPSGRSRANTAPEVLTQEQLHRFILSVLSGPEQRVLGPLLETASLDDITLAEKSQYSPLSSGYIKAKSMARSKGLIVHEDGSWKAADFLFI
jgi:hypothetical protein